MNLIAWHDCNDDNQQRALLMRDVATATAVSLQETAASITALRRKRYSTKNKESGDTPATPKASRSSPSSSPMEARTQILRTLNEQTKLNADQAAKDETFLTQILERFSAAQSSHTSGAMAVGNSDDVLLLASFLRQEDSSLVSWAARIYAELGITQGDQFPELTVPDIQQITSIPVLQKKRLIAVGQRFGLRD